MSTYIKTGSQPWLPNFSISVEGSDITETVRANLINISLTDYGGSEKKSDQISFAVVSETLTIPKKGVKISLSLGFGEQLVDKGSFVVDSAASGGSDSSPRVVEVTARAFSKTNARGHSALQSQKTRSFSGVTLADLVNTVATEHGLTARVPASLAGVLVSHIDQVGESDMNLITRLAERYGAVSKVTHDKWVLTPREGTTTVSGNPLPKITITPGDVSRWSYRDNSDHPDSSSAGSGTHVITYTDVTDGGKTKTITVGSGEPVVQYEWPMPDRESAQEIAAGFSTKSKKKLKSMSLDMPATPALLSLTAQCLVTTAGFGSAEDRDWQINRVDLSLGEQGFTIKLELE